MSITVHKHISSVCEFLKKLIEGQQQGPKPEAEIPTAGEVLWRWGSWGGAASFISTSKGSDSERTL